MRAGAPRRRGGVFQGRPGSLCPTSSSKGAHHLAGGRADPKEMDAPVLSAGVATTLTRHPGPRRSVSLAVAVLSPQGAAVATDSLHVELSAAPVMSTGYVKHVQVGSRLAAIVGVSDYAGGHILTWLQQALGQAATLDAVPDALIVAGRDALPAAYLRWRAIVGLDAADEEFLTVLLLEARPGHARALTASAAVVDDSLTLQRDHFSLPDLDPAVLVIGAADLELHAHTQDGKTLRLAQQLRGTRVSVPAVQPPPPGAAIAEYEAHARQLVDAAVSRENSLPRPHWWPTGMPVIAGPANSAHVTANS